MDRYTGLPPWVQKSKKSLKQTQEWQTFMMKLYDMVHHQMQEMGVGSFNDLAPPERQLLLQRGFQALKTSDAYFHLLETVSESLDESVSQEASKQSVQKQQNKTKMEILNDECHKAVTSLLQKWPDSKTSLRQCLNADIPLELRYVMWKNFLCSPRARDDYLKLVAKDPKKLVSRMDFEISQKCQRLLESDPTLRQIPNKKATCSVMRHVLSYRHMKSGERGGLVESDYHLCLPMVHCTLSAFHSSSSASTKQQQLTTEALASLVEEFDAFMEKRPAYMMSTQGPSLVDLTSKVGSLLGKSDPQLTAVLENLRIGQKDDSKKDGNRISIVLSFLLHSIVRSMFVGYLPLESVLHAWDLIVLGFDRPAYDPVPYICASLLILLHNDLVKSRSEKEAETVILKGCRTIQKNRLRLAIIELGFEKKLREDLDIANEGQFPVFHPAIKSNLPPWKHWYSSKIIAQLQEEKMYTEARGRTYPSSPDSSHGEEGPDENMWNLEQSKLELEEECIRLKEERDMLVTHVEEERRLRVEMQQHADDEIDRLRRQLHALQRAKRHEVPQSPKFTDRDSDIHAPPPTVASSQSKIPTPPPTKPKTPMEPVPEQLRPAQETPAPKTPEHSPEPQAQPPPHNADEEKAMGVTTDFVKKMMEGILTLANGAGKSKKELDRLTKKDIDKFSAAFNKAHVSVFGRSASQEEIDRLPTPERTEKMRQVQQETVHRLFNTK